MTSQNIFVFVFKNLFVGFGPRSKRQIQSAKFVLDHNNNDLTFRHWQKNNMYRLYSLGMKPRIMHRVFFGIIMFHNSELWIGRLNPARRLLLYKGDILTF